MYFLMKKSLIIFLTMFFLTSCASIAIRNDLDKAKRDFYHQDLSYYPATKVDIFCLSLTPANVKLSAPYGIAFFFGCLIDLPVSLTIDTVCLPADIYLTHKQQKNNNSIKDNIIKQE